MKLITQRSMIQSVADRWEEQYKPFTRGVSLFSERNGIRVEKTHMEILKELRAIDVNKASAYEVNQIIGNDSWTTIECNECGCGVDRAVIVGQEPDYESQTACLCRPCAYKAIELLA